MNKDKMRFAPPRKSLNILVAHNVPRARNGGMSRTMGFIHDYLVHAGHAVNYFCAEEIPSGLNGRWSRFTFPFLVRRHAVAAARAGKPYDLINVHEPSAAAISAYKDAAGNPVVVVTSYGVERRGWELALEGLRQEREGPTLKTRLTYPPTVLWQSRVGLQHANHIFCKNYEDRDYLVQWLGLPTKKITRIYPGADPTYATIARERDYAQADRLLFAGTWLERKGIGDLVPAFVTLAARRPELKLIVIGGGVSESAVRAAFPESLRPRVSCIQTADEFETAAAFAAADIYLLPSLFEGTPLTLIEAMMSGMPIVTTAVCGMKDVVRDGENGLLVPVRSPEAIVAAVERLLGDATLRARLGKTARDEALEKYTWKQVAVPILKVYEQLCEQRIQ